MAILYRMFKNKVSSQKTQNMWYAKAVVRQSLHTDDMAEIIQRNCSMKRSDVLAVLAELTEVMREQLLSGNRVCIDGIGAFKVGFSSTPAATPTKWNARQNVQSSYINFLPESITETVDGKRTRTARMLRGIEFQEMSPYDGSSADKD